MRTNRHFREMELAGLAKKFRQAAGKSKAEAARHLGVAAPTIFSAEERPDMSLTRLRVRIIEAYSRYSVLGPVYILVRKRNLHRKRSTSTRAGRPAERH